MNRQMELEQRVKHLEKLLHHASQAFEELVTEHNGRYLTTYSNAMDVTRPVKPALEGVERYFSDQRRAHQPVPPRLRLVEKRDDSRW
ncbi:hypothetical protein [Motiliproteus sp. MSK22-1]|uniref:hypothetical protein n=1 Tax=Motiliproteus sp. MSK22-1 TaxID=1897630 RepID=UPI000977FDD2|nr:hypothetical protein [Motiliproteus sp. MSK22-1]OMH39423.1 hypothetical protein BGP75_03695 [Motiliproteus sp. MSK22-1]